MDPEGAVRLLATKGVRDLLRGGAGGDRNTARVLYHHSPEESPSTACCDGPRRRTSDGSPWSHEGSPPREVVERFLARGAPCSTLRTSPRGAAVVAVTVAAATTELRTRGAIFRTWTEYLAGCRSGPVGSAAGSPTRGDVIAAAEGAVRYAARRGALTRSTPVVHAHLDDHRS